MYELDWSNARSEQVGETTRVEIPFREAVPSERDLDVLSNVLKHWGSELRPQELGRVQLSQSAVTVTDLADGTEPSSLRGYLDGMVNQARQVEETRRE